MQLDLTDQEVQTIINILIHGEWAVVNQIINKIAKQVNDANSKSKQPAIPGENSPEDTGILPED